MSDDMRKVLAEIGQAISDAPTFYSKAFIPNGKLINFAYVGANAQIFDLHLSIFLKPEMIRIEEGARIDGQVKIEGGQGVRIGKGTHISSQTHLNVGGGKTWIGDYVAVTSGAKIHSGSNTAAGQSMSSAAPSEMQVVERAETRIGDYAFIGSGAQVLMGVTVGEYAIVGAGAVVTKDIPAGMVAMGVPAKIVGRRMRFDNGHYRIAYFANGPELAELMEAMYP